MNTIVKTTHELVEGDVVVTHGMRCLIDGEIHTSRTHPDTGHAPTLYTLALVLNRDDVPNEVVPCGWTADWKRNARREALPHDGEHRWSIQGNGLARWYVEVSA